MRAPRERSVSHSLSCTALEWERIRELAELAGKPMSRFVVDRVLGRDGAGDTEAGDALVLDGDRQWAMHDAMLRAEAQIDRLVAPQSGDGSPDLAGSVRILFEARVAEMVRTGRHEAMEALLAPVVGPERAARIVASAIDARRRDR